MEPISRKQRNMQRLSEDTVEYDTEEEIFKEQKRRLRRQLNSVPAFSVELNAGDASSNTLQTRTNVKKQKKIDEILKEIAVLPETEYLNEDTNLRILKKMSVAKQYDNLRLSPAQEEKMAENKQKFEVITNQLWFLIQELESRKGAEPDIGEVPTVATVNKPDRMQQAAAKQKLEREHVAQRVAQQKVEDDKNLFVQHFPEKRPLYNSESKVIDAENDLEGVLAELEDVLHDSRAIVKEEVKVKAKEVAKQHSDINPAGAPDDTLELLEFLQKLEKTKQSKKAQRTSSGEKNHYRTTEINIEPMIRKKPVPLEPDTARKKAEPPAPARPVRTAIVEKKSVRVDDVEDRPVTKEPKQQPQAKKAASPTTIKRSITILGFIFLLLLTAIVGMLVFLMATGYFS